MKLLPFLRKRCGDISSVKGLKRAIDSKCVRVNGRIEIFSTHALRKGDRVEISLPKKIGKPFVLYENERLLIYDKPAGVVSEEKNFRGKLVHRLDKETSGILVSAKTEEARLEMIELFAQKKVHKTYLALVDGQVAKKEGRIVSNLVERKSPTGQIHAHSALKGKEAITLWKCLGVGKNASLLQCEPITGRTHQIRVHLKEMGHPVLGDIHYAKRFICSLRTTRHMLHAWKIAFDGIEVEAAIPEDFLEALKELGLLIT